jgi:alpha-L-fucosidase 2
MDSKKRARFIKLVVAEGLAFGLSFSQAASDIRASASSMRPARGASSDSRATARLWYRQPAKDWNEALPVGNGRLGAMVFGRPFDELIQLNEESLWAGSPIDNNNPESLRDLPDVRGLLFEGENEKAAALAEKSMLGTPPRIRSYEPLGDLKLVLLTDSGQASGAVRSSLSLKSYERDLVLREGIADTVFETATGFKYSRQVFASAADDVIVVRVETGQPSALRLRISLSRQKDASVTAASSNELVMTGQIMDVPDPLSGPAGAHMRFAARLLALHDGGRISPEPSGGSLLIENASAITILITAATDYSLARLGFDPAADPSARCAAILSRARRHSPADLRARHIAEHAALFDRVDLDLGSPISSPDPTDVRLEKLKAGGDDPGLAALYFQFGRYLLLGSSRRPAVLPANLQGIWNKDFKAAWNSDFHTNINLQMNYWPADVVNLPETVAPLSDFLERLVVPGRVTARSMYGAGGWTLHHLTDPFGRTGVADGVWGVSPMAGPWIALSLWDHYEFTADKDFLKRTAYPILKGAAEFTADFLVPSPEGWLVTAPSHSPENAYLDPKTGKPVMLTYGATIDIEIARVLFDSVIRAADILAVDGEFADRLKDIRAKLPPFGIGKYGNIQEWIKDFDEREPGHRHMSHLLGLYPLGLFTPETPELFAAARKTIERRLANGGGQTGWSRAWIICFYTRLLDGENAHANVLALLRKSTLSNLFDTHPPFQIDGNFGGMAGIAEMLVQSHGGIIRLLPALPVAWKTGSVKGLIARGAFEIAMTWRDGKIDRLEVLSTRGGHLRLANPFRDRTGEVKVTSAKLEPGAMAGEFIEVETTAGQRIVFEKTR